MGMKPLHADICRCIGVDCNIRSECRRYLERGDSMRLSYMFSGYHDNRGTCLDKIPREYDSKPRVE